MKIRIAALAVLLAASSILAASASSGSVGEAKMQPDGMDVAIDQAVVTAVGDGFAYAADLDRSCGIRLAGAAFPQVGTVIECAGLLSTTPGGERFLEVSSLSAGGTQAVKPWVIRTRWVGGNDLAFDPDTGAGQRGVTGGRGANTVGHLLTVVGRMTAVSADLWSLWIDDGSGPAPSGVRVDLPEPMDLEPGVYIRATGVCGLRSENGSFSATIQVTNVEDILPAAPNVEMVYVAAGAFTMGNTGAGMDAYEGMPREYPAHSVYVGSFWIGKTEVTRAQYRSFIQAGGYTDQSLWSPEGWAWRVENIRTEPWFWGVTQFWDYPPGTFTQTDSHPIVGVSFYEAEAFARWAGGRLPSEAEWEKAARWDGHCRVYPWGDLPSDELCNDWFDVTTAGMQTAPVGSYKGSVSPHGCLDMAGNVWEWTDSWFVSYPGSAASFDHTGEYRVMKGGSWYGMYGTRSACRFFAPPGTNVNDVGFRIAR